MGDRADLEAGDRTGQALGFLRQGVAGCRRLLNHGGVLLGHLIHLVDGGVDLLETGRLFLS